MADAPGRRGRVWLACGAAIGLGLAAAGAVVPGGHGRLPDDAVARVNHRLIDRQELAATLDRLSRERRQALRDEDRAHVLSRLIEEELLIQRGVELGLIDSDGAVRKAIASAMLDAIVAESRSRPPDEDELRAYHAANPGYFAPPPALRVRRVLFRSGSDRGDPESRARRAWQTLAGGGARLADVATQLGDAAIQPLPDALLPPSALREHIGSAALAAVLALEPGEISGPLTAPEGWQVIELVEREESAPPAFEAIRSRVEAAWVRERGDEALREQLRRLRAEADVVLAPDAPR